MSVKWKSVSKNVVVADYRDFYKWQETNRYKEIVKENSESSKNNTTSK